MQRTHSLTSLLSSTSASTALQNRYKNTDLSRPDLSTESLIPNASVFSRKARKQELPGSRPPVFNFPNGEVFTPRTAPSKRNRPARVPVDVNTRIQQGAPLGASQNSRPHMYTRLASMVLMPVFPSLDPTNKSHLGTNLASMEQTPVSHPSSHPKNQASGRPTGSFLTRSHSLNNFRKQSKLELEQTLRSTRLDTPTNISVRPPPVPPAPQSHQPSFRLSSLTNNRYAENAANIIRLELLVSVHGGLDSVPSSMSTTLNRSASHTPQTSVSGSDTAEIGKLWSSPESVSSFRTAQDPSPLPSIDEFGAVDADLRETAVPAQAPTGISLDTSGKLPASEMNRRNDRSLSSSPSSESEPPSKNLDDKICNLIQLGCCQLTDISLESSQSSESSSIPSPTISASTPPVTSFIPSALEADYVVELDLARDKMPEASYNGDMYRRLLELTSLDSKSTLTETPPPKSTRDAGPSILGNEAIPEESQGATESTATPRPAPDTTTRTNSLVASNDLHEVAEQAKETPPINSGLISRPVSQGVSPSFIPPRFTKTHLTGANAKNLEKSTLEQIVAANKADSMSSPESRNLTTPASDLPRSHPDTMITLPEPFSSSSAHDIQLNLAGSKIIGDSNDVESTHERLAKIKRANEEPTVDPTLHANEVSAAKPNKHGGADIYGSEMYTSVHINRFLADNQESVPPRRDVAVKDGAIEFHKSNSSLISSVNSRAQTNNSDVLLSKFSPNDSNANDMTSANAPRVLKPARSVARQSMLAVVDVDYDELLPPSPEGGLVAKGPLDEIQAQSPPKIRTPSPKKTEKYTDGKIVQPIVSTDSTSKGLKKFFNFMKRGHKLNHETTPKLKWKSLMSSLRSTRSSFEVNSIDTRKPEVNTLPSKQNNCLQKQIDPRTSGISRNKKKISLSNLKLTTGSKVYDLPSPMYSVREKTMSPNASSVTVDSEKPKFDLPEYDIESDPFNDVLLRFQEVEKEIENEVRVMRNSKSIHDFFFKDDELSKAQIIDLQKNDHQLSNVSLSEKNDSCTSVDAYDDVCNTSGSGELSDENASWYTTDFPRRHEKRTIVVDSARIQAALIDPHATKQSYLKFLRQFSDYDEMSIELIGFDPTRKAEATAESTESRQKRSNLEKTSSKSPRNVKFSSSISISETYAPQLYRRNNKSVTQYYLTKFSEINRIKNELNAYKCYEMLVHEKSQTNTHFFY